MADAVSVWTGATTHGDEDVVVEMGGRGVRFAREDMHQHRKYESNLRSRCSASCARQPPPHPTRAI